MVSLLEELVGRGMLAERDGTLDPDGRRSTKSRRTAPPASSSCIDMQLDRLTRAGAARARGREHRRAPSSRPTSSPPRSSSRSSRSTTRATRSRAAPCFSARSRAIAMAVTPRAGAGGLSRAQQPRATSALAPARRRGARTRSRARPSSHLLAKHFDAAGRSGARRSPPTRRQRAMRACVTRAPTPWRCAPARSISCRGSPARSRARPPRAEILGTLCRQVNSNSFSAAFAGREAARGLHARDRDRALARRPGQAVRGDHAAVQLPHDHRPVRSRGAVTRRARVDRASARAEPAMLQPASSRAATSRSSAPSSRPRCACSRGWSRAAEHVSATAGRAVALGHLACVRWVSASPIARSKRHPRRSSSQTRPGPGLRALGHVVRARIAFSAPRSAAGRRSRSERRCERPSSTSASSPRPRLCVVGAAQRGPLELAAIEADARRPPRATARGLDRLDARRASTDRGAAQLRSPRAGAPADRRDHRLRNARNERAYLPELLRIRGEQLEATDPAAARRDYREAIALARSTGARGLEQRAAASLQRN